MEKEEVPPFDETGYTSCNYGDSGSPVFVTSRVRKGWFLSKIFNIWEERSVLVAITGQCRKVPEHTFAGFTKDATRKCRMVATKITKDISSWLKTMGGISNAP